MKVFIDRSLPLCNANTGETPVPKGKTGIAVAVRAGSSRREALHIVDTFEHYFSHLGINLTATITAEDVSNKVDLKHTKLEEAYDLGRSIIQKANT